MAHANKCGKRQTHRERAIEWDLIEIPAQLIRDMARLDLTPAELIFIMYLLSVGHGWKQGHTIALPLRNVKQATGLSQATIHKAKRGLIEKGFMTIVNIRNQARTNTYDVGPMAMRLR